MKLFLRIAVCLMLIGAAWANPQILIDSLSSETMNFGQVPVGHQAVRSLWFTNIGDGLLWVIPGITGDGFQPGWMPNDSFVVARGYRDIIEVTFTPNAFAEYSGQLTLTTNDPDNPVIVVPLHGVGVDGPPPVTDINLLAPPDGTVMQSTAITFSWSALDVQGRVTYTLHVEDENPVTPDQTFDTWTWTTQTVDCPYWVEGETYHWYVTADWNGQTVRSVQTFSFTLDLSAGDLRLLTPENGAWLVPGPVYFTWTAIEVDVPVTYTLYVFGDTLNGDPREPRVVVVQDTTLYVIDNPPLSPGQNYSWWVTATWENGSAQSDYDHWFYINPNEVPPHFNLVSPEIGANITALSAEFMWTALQGAPSETFTYTLHVMSRDTMGGDPVYTFDAGTDTAYSADLSALPNHSAYTWWVTAQSLNGGEPVHSWGVFWFTLNMDFSHEMGAETQPEAVAKSFGVAAVYPNPFNPETNILLAVPAAGLVKAEIFDVLGRKVATLVDGALPAGDHNFSWRADGSAGLYFLRVTGPNGAVDLRKLMLVK